MEKHTHSCMHVYIVKWVYWKSVSSKPVGLWGVLFIVSAVLGIQPRVLRMLSKTCTIELHPSQVSLCLNRTSKANGMRSVCIRLCHLQPSPVISHLTKTCPCRWPTWYALATDKTLCCLVWQGNNLHRW